MDFYDPMEMRCPWCTRPPMYGSRRPGDRPPMYGSGRPGERPPMYGSGRPEGRPPMYGPGRPEGRPPMYGPGRPEGRPPMYDSERPGGRPPMYDSGRPGGRPPMYDSERPGGRPPMYGPGRPGERPSMPPWGGSDLHPCPRCIRPFAESDWERTGENNSASETAMPYRDFSGEDDSLRMQSEQTGADDKYDSSISSENAFLSDSETTWAAPDDISDSDKEGEMVPAPNAEWNNETETDSMSNQTDEWQAAPEWMPDRRENWQPAPDGMPGSEENRSPMPRQEKNWRSMTEDGFGLSWYYEDDYETERDMERLKDLYPEVAKALMPYIEEECDKLEFEGSVMFDEYPDKTVLSRITAHIYDQVKDRYNPPEGEDKDEMLAMNVETFRRYPPRKNWLSDLIDVLFFDEMFHRRCRRRNCRRW